METLRKPLTNILTLAAAVIFATVGFVYSPSLEGPAGMAMLIVVWIPLLIALVFLGVYFLLRIWTKDHAWIVSAIGVVILVYMGVGSQIVK